MARLPRAAQRVLERLHQEVGDAALAVGDADVERHGRHLLARHRLAHEYLADDGAVPVRDDEFVLELEQREQRAARRGGDGGLFRRGAAYLGRVGRVAAHGDEQAVGKAGRGGHRGISQ